MSKKVLANGGIVKAQPVPVLMSSACDTISKDFYIALVVLAEKIKRGDNNA